MAVDFTMLNRIVDYKTELDQVNRLIDKMEADEPAKPVQIQDVLNEFPKLTSVVESATDGLNSSFLEILRTRKSDLEELLSHFTITEG